MDRLNFHFGIEINDDDFLWIHGNLGRIAFKWILRRFWKLEVWDYTKDNWDDIEGLVRVTREITEEERGSSSAKDV